jgi:hypothetical protein
MYRLYNTPVECNFKEGGVERYSFSRGRGAAPHSKMFSTLKTS